MNMKGIRLIRFVLITLTIVLAGMALQGYRNPSIKEDIIPAGENLPAFTVTEVKDYTAANYYVIAGVFSASILICMLIDWPKIKAISKNNSI